MCFLQLDGIRETYGARDREISSYLCVGGKLNSWDLIFFKNLFIYLGVLDLSCGMQGMFPYHFSLVLAHMGSRTVWA